MKDPRTRGVTLQRLRKKVFDYYGDECWLCHRSGADTIDHIIPVADGGTDDLDNLRPAHGRKSSTCAGNFSRKRAPMRHQVARIHDDGLIVTDDYIERHHGHMISRIFYRGFIPYEKALEMAQR